MRWKNTWLSGPSRPDQPPCGMVHESTTMVTRVTWISDAGSSSRCRSQRTDWAAIIIR
jgi:hypothetical protein